MAFNRDPRWYVGLAVGCPVQQERMMCSISAETSFGILGRSPANTTRLKMLRALRSAQGVCLDTISQEIMPKL